MFGVFWWVVRFDIIMIPCSSLSLLFGGVGMYGEITNYFLHWRARGCGFVMGVFISFLMVAE